MHKRPLILIMMILLIIPGLSITGVSGKVSPDMRSPCQIAVERMPVWNLTPDQAALLIEGSNPVSKGMHIYDLRTSEEFKAGHIPGAEQVNPAPEFLKVTLSSINSTNPVFIYGRNGADSESLIPLFEDAGCTGVFHLTGGFTAWNISGRTVTT